MNKLHTLVAVSVVSAIGFAVPASASILTFKTIVNSAQEIPTPTDRGAVGEATITVDTIAQNIDFGLSVIGLDLADLGGLPQSVLDTAGPVHLHVGDPTQTGPIAVAFGPTSSSKFSDNFPFAAAAIGAVPGFSLSALDVEFGSETAFDTFFDQLSTGSIYVNVHTFLNPSGEIRGNFAGLDPVAAVPLPASVLLLLGSLGGLYGMRRKRV